MSAPLPVSDDHIELKKRARRRLIGAAVFATVAAVVLPMVMDKEPPPALPGIDLRIPSQDKGFVAPQVKPAVPTVAEPVAPAPIATEPPKALPLPPELPKPTPAPKAAEPVKPPPAPKPAEPRPAAKATPEAKTAATKEGDARRAQAILDGKPARSSTEGPHAVLIGAFADPANVVNLKKKIGELGLPVYTEPLDSPQGRKTRVRAGPFPNRDAAEKAAARLKAIGVSGVVAAKS